MFDIGFWEFALIGVITLIIVGPEKMPAIARKAGKYAGKAKRFMAKIQEDIDDKLEADKIKEHLNLQDEDSNVLEVLEDTKSTLDDIKKDVNKS